MTVTYEVEAEPDIICGECDRPLPPGSPIGEALEGMAERKAIVLTVCVYCAMRQPRHHCPRCECICEGCGYVVNSSGCRATEHARGQRT